jgi:hypothetical protein
MNTYKYFHTCVFLFTNKWWLHIVAVENNVGSGSDEDVDKTQAERERERGGETEEKIFSSRACAVAVRA